MLRSARRHPWGDAFALHALVGAARGDILEFLRASVGPRDRDAIDPVTPSDAERQRQLRLRQIARPALHDARLRRAAVKHTDRRSNCVTIRRAAHETEPDAAV